MTGFLTALGAEYFKFRKSNFILTIIGFALIPIAITLPWLNDKKTSLEQGLPLNYFQYNIEDFLSPYITFIFPVFLILMASKITYLDHKNGGWEQMEQQPVKKVHLYISKFVLLLLSNLLFWIVMILGAIGHSLILSCILGILPEGIDYSVPFYKLFRYLIIINTAAAFSSALVYAIGVKINHFLWPFGIGLSLLIGTQIAKINTISFVWSPFAIIEKNSKLDLVSDFGHWFTYDMYIGLVLAIFTLTVGYLWYNAKSFSIAFLRRGKSSSLVAIVALITTTTSLYLLFKPKVMPLHNRTVIKGTTDSNLEIKTIYLTNPIIGDTIAQTGMKNKSYSFKTVPIKRFGTYRLHFDNKTTYDFILEPMDSVYISSRIYKSGDEHKLVGTAIAENQAINSGRKALQELKWSLDSDFRLKNPQRTEEFILEKLEEYRKITSCFYTADNYKSRNSYNSVKADLGRITVYTLWKKYIEKWQQNNPGKKYPSPSDQLKRILPNKIIENTTLLNFRSYVTYLTNELNAHGKGSGLTNNVILNQVKRLKNDTVIDFMRTYSLLNIFQEEPNGVVIDSIYKNSLSQIRSKKYKNFVSNEYLGHIKLKEGKPMYFLKGITPKGERKTLENYKGKPTVIYVWATWCGPCKVERPYFEKWAKEYPDLNFISLSIDSNNKAWLQSINNTSDNQIHLITEDLTYFQENSKIKAIPHFILLDADGNFISYNFSNASDFAFSKVLETL